MKRHLRFLRDYKRTLKLRLNAQEDLLLNGAKEPTSRGVCHHLLSKVDYTLVATAASRMPKEDRPRLLAGVLGFKHELAFLLLYLECLKEAARDDATLALEQALEHIDFASVSEGQMRRVLELIVELFSEGQRATLMLGLLESKSFREAFDQSLPKLPEALMNVVTPLRAVHAVVLKGHESRLSDSALTRGVELLLEGDVRALTRRPSAVRARFFRIATSQVPDVAERHSGSLQALLDSFDPESELRTELELTWIRHLLQRERYRRAEKRLAAFLERRPASEFATELLSALRAPRLGHIAQLGTSKNTPIAHLNPAFSLADQRPLWLRTGGPADVALFERHAEETRSVALPRIARPLQSGVHQGSPFVAYPRTGELLTERHPAWRHRPRALSLAYELCACAAALAGVGLATPDLNLRRFEIDLHDQVRFVNLWDANTAGTSDAKRAFLDLTKQRLVPRALLSKAECDSVDAALDFGATLDVLDGLSWLR